MDQLRTRETVDRMKTVLLPPKREVSGQVPVHIIPRTLKKLKAIHGPAPAGAQKVSNESNYSTSIVKPCEQSKMDVELVISDYLHSAKCDQTKQTDSRVGNLVCTCCMDRNKENLQKKFHMRHIDDPDASKQAKDLPEQHRKQSYFQVHNSHTLEQPNFSFSKNAIFVDGISSPSVPVNYVSTHHAFGGWEYYQPVPNSGTFLNTKFNRPFVRQSQRMTTRDIAKYHFMTRKVTEASKKYEDSMLKLQEHFEKGFVLPEGAIYLKINR